MKNETQTVTDAAIDEYFAEGKKLFLQRILATVVERVRALEAGAASASPLPLAAAAPVAEQGRAIAELPFERGDEVRAKDTAVSVRGTRVHRSVTMRVGQWDADDSTVYCRWRLSGAYVDECDWFPAEQIERVQTAPVARTEAPSAAVANGIGPRGTRNGETLDGVGIWDGDGRWLCACDDPCCYDAGRNASAIERCPKCREVRPPAAAPAAPAVAAVPFAIDDNVRARGTATSRNGARIYHAIPVVVTGISDRSADDYTIRCGWGEGGDGGDGWFRASDLERVPVAPAVADVALLAKRMREAAEEWSDVGDGAREWVAVQNGEGHWLVQDARATLIADRVVRIEARHIAAACPANVIALCDELKRLAFFEPVAESRRKALIASERQRIEERDDLRASLSAVTADRDRLAEELADIDAANAALDARIVEERGAIANAIGAQPGEHTLTAIRRVVAERDDVRNERDELLVQMSEAKASAERWAAIVDSNENRARLATADEIEVSAVSESTPDFAAMVAVAKSADKRKWLRVTTRGYNIEAVDPENLGGNNTVAIDVDSADGAHIAAWCPRNALTLVANHNAAITALAVERDLAINERDRLTNALNKRDERNNSLAAEIATLRAEYDAGEGNSNATLDQMQQKLNDALDQVEWWRKERAAVISGEAPNEVTAERDKLLERLAIMLSARDLRAQEIRSLRAEIAVLKGQKPDVPAPQMPTSFSKADGTKIE